jgi:hypothetical protein
MSISVNVRYGRAYAAGSRTDARHFATGIARLPSKGIEAGEVVLIDTKGHDAGFLASSPRLGGLIRSSVSAAPLGDEL